MYPKQGQSHTSRNSRHSPHPVRRSAGGSGSSAGQGAISNCSCNNTHSAGKKHTHKKGRHIHLGPPRCSRAVVSTHPATSSFTGYGRSTDPTCENPSLRATLLNPYAEMNREVQEEIRRKYEEIIKSLPPEVPDVDAQPKSEAPGGGDQIREEGSSVDPMPKDLKEKGGRGDEEQDDDEDDDEEGGMPQAVWLEEPLVEPQTSFELLKVFHRARMETACKEIKPKRLTRHLKDAGYFNYNYHGHTRTTNDNTNLRNGNKKGIERLYTLLAVYS